MVASMDAPSWNSAAPHVRKELPVMAPRRCGECGECGDDCDDDRGDEKRGPYSEKTSGNGI